MHAILRTISLLIVVQRVTVMKIN